MGFYAVNFRNFIKLVVIYGILAAYFFIADGVKGKDCG
ncbi:hypothetical protein HCH_04004 [Hahella chejuensis KCTC 2396]|uniref:Uncharacterized protein n=1 Tax=Hahella chejuensis (strain KCTC 2396) TaxID=349521 RepID=Q2SF53_HAHCH|nr:hypothetical protein HCH_04004 [Hahella chejuensis KCTC 2396]